MNFKARTIIGYLSFTIGIGLLTSMTTVLHRGAEAAMEYQEVISPLFTEQPSVWGGTSEEEKKLYIRTSIDENINIRMLQARMDNQLNPELARWLLYAGVFLLILAAPLMRQPKTTKTNEGAEPQR